MIIKIKGKVIQHFVKDNHGVVDIETQNGLGYRVLVPGNYKNYPETSEISLFTYFHVREDSQVLFGFLTTEERDLFEILISVSGVGPKTGISILSLYTAEKVKEIILSADHVSLSKVKGLGGKGAKKIILELSGVLTTNDESKEDIKQIIKELKEALKALGYKGEDVVGMVKIGEKMYEDNNSLSIEELLQKVLRGS